MHFNFEKNLDHQTQAVESTLAVFENLDIILPAGTEGAYSNPEFVYKSGLQYGRNITAIRQSQGIEEVTKGSSNIIDIMMETGTGKTYTYAKTMFELNRVFGIFKFVIVVPTLSIKAGTISFLSSESSRAHFKELYGKTLQLHIVESQKGGKSKKARIPVAVSSFVNAGSYEKGQIQVLVINAGMVTSETMQKSYDRGLHDKYLVPFEGLAATRPFLILDEPHKFSQSNKTWESIQQIKPQFLLRYGATFPENTYENLVYKLTAVDSFNQNLIKGVIGHIAEAEGVADAAVKFIDSDGTEARFELLENDTKKIFSLSKKESLSRIHPAMEGLTVENVIMSKVALSNGLDLKRGDKINPYSFSETVQESMIKKAIANHFKKERALLTRVPRIKPLTLFFIDNIEEYRNKDGNIRRAVESAIVAGATALLKEETDPFYRRYLEKTLENVAATHGGYFSKDNSEKDEAIEKEISEILHDKQAMLDLENPRRFIFSKWTLREGWDNPNVFQICKLRTSGSDISKLQEVGRGLRLPVNEHGNRVKEEAFFLDYFVDFTERDFIQKLVGEINQKSGALTMDAEPERLTPEMIKVICDKYEKGVDTLLGELDRENIITRSNEFKKGGFDYIRKNYPRIFEGVDSNKVRLESAPRKKVQIRKEKYGALKALWEKLNEKVILEYGFGNEQEFERHFTRFLVLQEGNLKVEKLRYRTAQLGIEDKKAVVRELQSVNANRETPVISTMGYSTFLKELSRTLFINIKTLNNSFKDSGINMTNYLSISTVRKLTAEFRQYLLFNAVDKFSVAYKQVTNVIHPTALTNAKGEVLSEVLTGRVGKLYSEDSVARNYLFDALYYDSDLERQNIKAEIKEVVVFTKIPSNSIKIPVAGGSSYSPDFAYVIKFEGGEETLHFIVETKDLDNKGGLRETEKAKIRHAEKLFGGRTSIHFCTQFDGDKITDLINDAIREKG